MIIQHLLEQYEELPLYRGSTRAYEIGDLMQSRPRDSISGNGNLARDAWDKLAIPQIPELKGTAPRSNCIFCTRDPEGASGFGNVYQVEVVEQTSRIVWMLEDFNYSLLLHRIMDTLYDVAIVAKQPLEISFDMIPNLQKAIDEQPSLQQHWNDVVKLAPTIEGSFIMLFKQQFANGYVEVVESIDQVPKNAAEIWFSGAVRVVDNPETDDQHRDW